MSLFYDPTSEHLTKLDTQWCASYSGGKDSTSLVTWIEYLRRSGWLTIDRPQLVQSDTKVEDVVLQSISAEMMDLLRKSGWECAVVEPLIHEKLYNRILGIGNTPIHPGIRRMRWCTRSTKIDPMERWRKVHSGGLCLTGLRMGESSMRDGKLKKKGCGAGGECGIPDPSERTYSPILHWSVCHVIDWLNGSVARDVYEKMKDVFEVTRKLVSVYGVRVGQSGFGFGEEPEVEAARFGCIGCPAIVATRQTTRANLKKYGHDHPLNELADVWFEARRRCHRCRQDRTKRTGMGPIKIEIRKILFARVMDIQKRANVILITPDDEAFIRQCWENKVYPRGWSEADELTPHPDDAPLFA